MASDTENDFGALWYYGRHCIELQNLWGIVEVLDSHKITALINWLAAGAPPKMNFLELVAEMGKRMVSAGLPIDLFGIYNTMIHPQLPGRFFYWTEYGGSKLNTITSDQLRHGDLWMGSPGQVCQDSGRVLIYNFGESPEYDSRPDMMNLAKRGYKQSVFTPLHSQYLLASSVSSYSTKKSGGFTQEETHVLRLIQAQIARIVEAFVLHEGTVQILSTYVGRGAGQRVLQGNIARGDAEIIPSIVLFTDLKDFTSLSNTRPAREVIELLNKFYDIAEYAIGKNGGEILKFMGDGLLVIFPTPDDLSAQMAAATGAIEALEETRRELTTMDGNSLHFRAALHLGDIHYGNIGSKTRLDFTAIGPTVNLAARLMSAADEFKKETVCSLAFHQLVPDRTTFAGERAFKGFETSQKVFFVN